jgi:hypothetical protein
MPTPADLALVDVELDPGLGSTFIGHTQRFALGSVGRLGLPVGPPVGPERRRPQVVLLAVGFGDPTPAASWCIAPGHEPILTAAAAPIGRTSGSGGIAGPPSSTRPDPTEGEQGRTRRVEDEIETNSPAIGVDHFGRKSRPRGRVRCPRSSGPSRAGEGCSRALRRLPNVRCPGVIAREGQESSKWVTQKPGRISPLSF